MVKGLPGLPWGPGTDVPAGNNRMLPTGNFCKHRLPQGVPKRCRTSSGMSRGSRPGGVAVAVALAAVLVAVAAPAAAAAPAVPIVVSGLGGQSTQLVAPRGGLVIEYPLFREPRLPGPDGAVGGVVIRRASDGRLVGGEVLQNAPGFNRALTITLVGTDRTVLAAGRYAVTLLGAGRQAVHLTLRGHAHGGRLLARGPARPITRVIAATAPVASAWSDALGTLSSQDYLVTGAGSGGDNQQASEQDLCLQQQGAVAAPCLIGGGMTFTPGPGGAGSWSGDLYPPGTLRTGSYLFTGNAVGAGPMSVTGRAAVVISLRR